MSQFEELKAFVSERLIAAASEIVGAFAKTITDYEEQNSRLKEENNRNRSLLDIILNTKSTDTKADSSTKSRSPAASAVGPLSLDSRLKSKTGETAIATSTGLQTVFIAREDFLRFTAEENCPFCLKREPASEKHLMQRHYFYAVHFIEDGTEKFAIPCLCKDKIAKRSHWHCPSCKKLIFRRCNFETHLSKQHEYPILQKKQDAETHQPTVSVLEVQLVTKPWDQQEVSHLEQQPSPLLQIKEEKRETEQEVQQPQQLLIEDKYNQRRKQSQEPNDVQNFASSVVCVDTCIQDRSGISNMENSGGETRCTTGNSAVAENGSCSKTESKTTRILGSSVSELSPKIQKCAKRSLPPVSLNLKKATWLSAGPTGSYCCKACGKTFHYMYTLRSHVHTHARDKICICGICGKHLGYRASLVQHLQIHNKRKKCRICGKEFSSDTRLKQHKRFHRPMGGGSVSSP